MRRFVALLAALGAVTLCAGSPQAASTEVSIAHPGNSHCTTIGACYHASLWLNRVTSEQSLPHGRVMIVTPDLEWGTALLVDYRQGQSLRRLIATDGGSGARHAARYHHPRILAHHAKPEHPVVVAKVAPEPVREVMSVSTPAPAESTVSPASTTATVDPVIAASAKVATGWRLVALTKKVKELEQVDASGHTEALQERVGRLEKSLGTLQASLQAKQGLPALLGWFIALATALIVVTLAAVALIAYLIGVNRTLKRGQRPPRAPFLAAAAASPLPADLNSLVRTRVRCPINPACVEGDKPAAFEAVIEDVIPQLRDIGRGPLVTAVLMGCGPWDEKPDGSWYDALSEIGYVQGSEGIVFTHSALASQLGKSIGSDDERARRIRAWSDREGITLTRGTGKGILRAEEMRLAA